MGRVCASRFRQSVSVQSFTEVDDGFGGRTRTGPTEKFKIFGQVKQVSGAELFNRQQLESSDVIEVTTRYRSDILDTDVLIFAGFQYDIKRQENIDFRNRFLVITAERQIDE